MGVLSSNERKGLEDVFMSIDVNKKKYKPLKFFISDLHKVAKHGLKETNLTTFSYYLFKKKKNLSK